MTKTTNEQRESLISDALSTPEGKAALHAAMTAPVNTPMMYQSIGRKLLMVEDLPGVSAYPGAYDTVSDYMKKWVQK